jgi:hypothetical protein
MEGAMMRALSGLLSLVVVIGTLYFLPGLAATLGLDVPSLPGLLREVREELARERALEEQNAAVLASAVAKERLIADLIARRLTMAEAVAGFRALDEANPYFNEELFVWDHPGASDEERYRHEVLCYLRARLPGVPDEELAAYGPRKARPPTTSPARGGSSSPPEATCPPAGQAPLPVPTAARVCLDRTARIG